MNGVATVPCEQSFITTLSTSVSAILPIDDDQIKYKCTLSAPDIMLDKVSLKKTINELKMKIEAMEEKMKLVLDWYENAPQPQAGVAVVKPEKQFYELQREQESLISNTAVVSKTIKPLDED